MTHHVLSRDGTPIAFERRGEGPPLILVVGAFNLRSAGEPLATYLAPHFTVYTYDRRGRGDSGDTLPYAVGREIDDLAALVEQAGGAAAVFGYSSGAALALQATAHRLPITRLALYDPPFVVPNGPSTPSIDHTARLAEMIAAGRRGDAVEYFQSRVVGIPENVVMQLRQAPFRPALEAIAHTLVYETTILGDGTLPTAMVAAISVPTVVIAGGASAFMRASASVLAAALPDGRLHILENQTHDIDPSAVGPVLCSFLHA